MKVEYCVEPTIDVFIDDKSEMPEKLRLDDADVWFDIGEDNLLKKISVTFTGLAIKLQKGGGRDGQNTLINPSYPEIHEKAFGIFSYLFNRLQEQTGQQAVDVSTLKDVHPAVAPETEGETVDWNSFNKIICAPFRIVFGSVGSANLADYEENFRHAKAYANFADAKNTDDPVSKYERLYKVVESFFSGTGKKFDQNVTNFMIQFDSSFVPDNFEELRQLRNRCVHSKDKKHVTSGDLELLSEVASKSEKLERIADLLLKHK
ncbi:hypothetical protein GMJAKD_12845 [Candidatus Electrothrix aarhusensis]